jgi:hypothetical protein
MLLLGKSILGAMEAIVNEMEKLVKNRRKPTRVKLAR